MRIYLAAAGANGKYGEQGREAAWAETRPKYLLTSFADSPKDLKVTLDQVGVNRFFLDSGAYVLQRRHDLTLSDFYEYTDRYSDYITRHRIRFFAEMDVENIIGIHEVEKLRHRIESRTGAQTIPVWHTGRGLDYWKKMVAEYDYVALGDLTVRNVVSYLPIYRKMVDYANAHGTKVHGLGFTRTEYLPTIDFYSVDSAAWSRGGAYGIKSRFTGRMIERVPIKLGEEQRTRFGELTRSNFAEWCKYQRWADHNLYPNTRKSTL